MTIELDEFIVRMKNTKPYIYKDFISKEAQAGLTSEKAQQAGTIRSNILPVPENATINIDSSKSAYITMAATPVHNINKSTNYVTIQAAIDNASAGDEIQVDSALIMRTST